MKKTMKTMDGNTAAGYVSYAMTEVAAIYPITPSSNMAEIVDEWSANGKKNIFGQEVLVSELQSEAGAAGAVHGSLSAGALTSTYTASQGLLLMIPNMYKIAGELLPGVFHVSARAIAGHALSIFGDHSDVMACRQTGFALLASGSVQEVMDLGGIAHLAAIKSRVPFLHFFDGFRTSHEVQKIEAIDYSVFADLIDRQALKEFRDRALNPEHPVLRGTAQNPDIFFQAKEASNRFYEAVPDIVADYMKKISEVTGRDYRPFNYYGAPDAEYVYIIMGSAAEALEETIDYLISKGEKVGMIKVRLYRPFSAKYFFDVLPETVKRIAVLDRCKEPGSLGEPLYEDVRTLFYGMENAPMVIGGRYGLGSKDVTPSQLKAVFDNLVAGEPKNGFTIGIVDDVTGLSLPEVDKIRIADEGTTRCKFWGFGSDGTVGANKDAIKIIGDHTDLYAQGYFSYDSKKSGGVTISHLRFGRKPIRSTYLIDEADFIACHKQAYVDQYEILEGLKEGGTFLLNCLWTPEELDDKLPAKMKKYIADNNIDFYIINAVDIAGEIGLGGRINMVMQSAFFKLANVIPYEEAVKYMKEAIEHTYGRKGEKIVSMNCQAVDRAAEALVKVDVPAHWSNAVEEAAAASDLPEFIEKVVIPMNRQQGDKLPVSTFVGREDGTFPQGTSHFEKRGIAIFVPEWNMDNCIQCNQCALVCPHAAIRPFLLNEEEVAAAPETFASKMAAGKQLAGLNYRIQVSPYDCAGCGSCADVCPAKTKALIMKPVEGQIALQADNWNHAVKNILIKDNLMELTSIKGSQFVQPLLEFSGACAGCGETPYVKLITQLFGDRMMIANATGCTSIWGGSAPSTPYCTNKEGKGPAWANSLFEDNAEYGYGMVLGVKKIREKLGMLMEDAIEQGVSDELEAAFREWIEGKDNAQISKDAAAKIVSLLAEHMDNAAVKEIANRVDFLVKKSQWVIGGDGWAYDIGYGGLDHVISTGEDINILVLDTEVYSNTGGQASKSTPAGAVAKFAAAGKRTRKKDLGLIATTYGEVYVAQIAMGANMNQTIKVLAEAEAYPGPSVIIAYAPCINHSIKGGLAKAMEEMKRAVDAGYWHLWRYNPLLKEEGKNPFVLESKEPTIDYKEFLKSEGRYTTLMQAFPEVAEALFDKAARDARDRYEAYKRMAMECK
ncbi:pyruvate:ferredoxin (flavodoxin) oxidoreductase [Desulfitibacter alkalitolerans]|uniref:pyruvate:ferredoxin (flavodoxin) oxidoreductase n=1 Tax=Desulfitibacter alkalitolerans TaxID=264641 RepID=UPI0004801769|nr:pyruvate:ferredoxin (flavodoxin) oxidoreductase [Desulfitibacter alkalitolerans]